MWNFYSFIHSIWEISLWCWTRRPGSQSPFQFIPKVLDWVEVRALCSSTPNSSNHVFMELALCTGAQTCWNRKGPSSNWSTYLEAQHCPKCLHQTLQSAQYSQAGNVLQTQTEVWLVTSQNRFPLLQSPVSVCFTHSIPLLALYLMMWGFMQMLSYGNPFRETLPHSFCADINASGSLELFSFGNF